MVDLAQQMRRHYHDSVELQFREKQGRMPHSGTEIRRAMLEDAYFKAWSALRYSAQEQTWWSVQPQVERNAAQIAAFASVALYAAFYVGEAKLEASTLYGFAAIGAVKINPSTLRGSVASRSIC